jgi:hypothetical protein
MIQSCRTRTALICVVVCFVLLVAFLMGSTVQADGGGDQWPTNPPDPNSSIGDGGDTDGIEAMLALTSLLQLIL